MISLTKFNSWNYFDNRPKYIITIIPNNCNVDEIDYNNYIIIKSNINRNF